MKSKNRNNLPDDVRHSHEVRQRPRLPPDTQRWWEARESLNLCGVFERTKPGGYRLRPEKFDQFLDSLKSWRDALVAWRRVAPHGPHAGQHLKVLEDGNWSSEAMARAASLARSRKFRAATTRWLANAERLRLKADRAKAKFEKKYAPLANALWRLDAGQRPFFDPVYFPRTDDGRNRCSDLVGVVNEICMIGKKAKSSGALSHGLSEGLLPRAEGLRRKGNSFPKIVEMLHPDRAHTEDRDKLIKRYWRKLRHIPPPALRSRR